jgi:hypothetical protein
VSPLTGDRRFESTSLQRGVRNEPRSRNQPLKVSTTGLVDTKQQAGPTKRRKYPEALKRQMVASPEVAAAVETAAEQKPARRPLPEHLPREDLQWRSGPYRGGRSGPASTRRLRRAEGGPAA